MVLVVFSGCGTEKKQEDSSQQVTLKWVIPSPKQVDFEKVEAEVNKLLPTLLPNTKLELVLDMAMGDKWSLWMSGKTSFDIAQSGYANELQTEIMKNSYLSLNDLIDQYAPTIKKEMTETYKYPYLTGTNEGKLYAIPNIQYHIKETTLVKINTEFANFLDIDKLVKTAYASPKATEELYKVFDDAITKSDAARKSGQAKINVDIQRFYKAIAKRGYIFIGGLDSNLCYDPYAEKIEIVDFFTTDAFKTHMKYAEKWYNNENIPKDILTGVTGDQSGGYIVCVDGGRYGLNERSFFQNKNSSGKDEIAISINNPQNDILGSFKVGSLATYTSIPFTAKNPARAMQLLELLRTPKGAPLLNMIVYGIKDVHYKQINDKMIDPLDYDGQASSSSKYGIPNWLCGNMFNMFIVNPPYDEKTVEYGKNYYENYLSKVKKTQLSEFNFDLKPVKSEMSQIYSNNKELEPQLAFGVLKSSQATYDNLMSKNKTAKLETIMQNFKKQADDYLAKK
jgi:putative aldouronate transport system substrate-binding protein